LSRVLLGVTSWQVRTETSLDRAVASRRVAPQLVAALLALGAVVTTQGEDGLETVSLEEYLGREARGRVAALHIPGVAGDRRWGEARVARTPADEPIVAAIAVVDEAGGKVTSARVALTGVWPEPFRLAQAPASLEKAKLDAASIEEVAAGVEKEVAPVGNFLGSSEYRRAMAGVLTRRALQSCLSGEAGDE
jgi:CO/xanthine dehydrogenase FAD-binding subunit